MRFGPLLALGDMRDCHRRNNDGRRVAQSKGNARGQGVKERYMEALWG